MLPKDLDEKVARLHLPALGADLTTLSKEQAEYISVEVEGPHLWFVSLDSSESSGCEEAVLGRLIRIPAQSQDVSERDR